LYNIHDNPAGPAGDHQNLNVMLAKITSPVAALNEPTLEIRARHALLRALEQFPRKALRKGELIYSPNDIAREIFLVVEGRIKMLVYSADGRELIKQFHSRGEFFGEGALLRAFPRHNFAVANISSVIIAIPTEAVWKMIEEDTQHSIFFLSLFSRQLACMEHRLESMAFHSSRKRILEFLIELVEQKGEKVGFEWVIRHFMAHQDIANATATSRQSVNVALNELKRNEVITFNRRRLLVRDLDRLKAIAAEQR
jgi:CRP/FNR family cyclic AMP-dependent transcriptional regulator